MNKNRMRGLRWGASKHMIAKPISIKTTGGKSGGCAWKAVELTSGDLRRVTKSWLGVERFTLMSGAEVSGGRSSPEEWRKARTVPRKGNKGKASRGRDS